MLLVDELVEHSVHTTVVNLVAPMAIKKVELKVAPLVENWVEQSAAK
jgi:hypothetical protein